MAGLISDIVGGNVDSDLDKLVAKLAAVEKELDVINGKAITIKVDLQGVGTLSELTNLYKQQDEILTKLRSTSVQYVDTYKMATEVIKQHNGHSKEFVAVSQGIAKTTAEEARARKENAKALLDEQKYVAALAKEKEALEKKTVKAQQAAEKENNAYLQLRKTYNEQSTALKGMIIQYGEADAAVVKMKADVDKMYTSLLKAEQAVGQHQRKVGQYQNAILALSQIIREAPAFTYSVTTGLTGIGNNIPILLDQFKLLRAEVGSTGKALKILGASLFGFTNLVSLGLTVLTLYTSGFFDFSKEADKAAKSGNDFNATLKGINEEARSTALIEIANTDKLFATSTDLNSAYSDRVAAIEKLISLYPELLGNLEREDFLTGNVAGKQKIQDIISYKSAIEARKKSIEEINKEISALKSNTGLDDDGLNKFGETYDPLDYTGSVFSTRSPKTEAEIRRLTSLRESFEFAKDSFEKSLADLTSTRHAGRIWMDIDNDIKQQERLVKTTVQGTKEHTKALSELKRYQEEMDVYMGRDKQKKEKKDTISDDLAAAKSDYELQLMLNQQKFVNSRKTYHEEQQLNADNLKATMEYGERYTMIVEEFNKKHLITENEHIKLINEANKILLEGQIKAKEAGDKIEEEILKKKIQTNNEMLKYIESLSKQRQELEKINREIDAIQDKAASRKEYAESFAPYLEGFGFNTAFGQQVKQKNQDISSRKTELGVLQGQKPTEESDPKSYGMRLLQWETNVAKERENIAKMEADRDEMYNQKMIEGKKRVAQATIDFATTAINEIQARQEDSYKRQLAYIDEMQRKAMVNSQLEIQAIQGRTAYQIEKENEIAKVTAQARSQEAAFEAERRSIAIAQAKFTRQNAIATAILNGAVGVTKIWAEYAAQPIIAAALTALQAGVVASQIARAQSAPVPTYAKGTDDHRGGLAIIGDGGEPEFVTTPTGRSFWSKSTSTLVDLPKHSTVTPLHKIQQFAINGVGMSAQVIKELSNNKESLNDKRIVQKLEDIHDAFISSALRNKTNVNVNIKSTTNRRIYNQL